MHVGSRGPARLAPDIDRRLSARQYVSIFSDRLIVSAGTLEIDAPTSGTGPLKKGLKIVVILSGKEQIKVADHPTLEMNGPQSCLIYNEDDANKVHWLAADIPLRFVLVQLDPSLTLDEFGFDAAQMLRNLGQGRKPLLHVQAASQVLMSLASQIITCPLQEPLRKMYLIGKGLELAASALNPVIQRAQDIEISLSSSDLQRIHAAYDRLTAALDKPPSLAELGREVGLNTTKLTIGFRRVFGATVFAVLQEHRLQQAYRMLASGQTTVSEAAYRVGYSPAHFATIFRRRFGVAPKTLR